jgi:hypothetical protein
MLSSQRVAVATPHVPFDQWPLCISFLPIVDLVPVRELMLECRNVVDSFLGSIGAMHRILTDFAVYDAGPTYWKMPRVISGDCLICGARTNCSNVSPIDRYSNLEPGSRGVVCVGAQWVHGELRTLLMQQIRWMDNVAFGHFAEVTSAAPCAGCSRPVYIPFCELRSSLLRPWHLLSSHLGIQFREPDDVDEYMRRTKRGPRKFVTQHETLYYYALAAIWRDLAVDGHVDLHEGYTHRDYHEPIAAKDWRAWLNKAEDRVILKKLWAMWAVAMKALLKVNVMLTLLVGERHIVGDPQHDLPGRVAKHTESVFSVLSYEKDGGDEFSNFHLSRVNSDSDDGDPQLRIRIQMTATRNF